jgi:hypothetical protein
VRTNEWDPSTAPNRNNGLDEDMLDIAVIAAGDGTYHVLNASNGVPKINLSTNPPTTQPKTANRPEQLRKPAPSRMLPPPASNSLIRVTSRNNLRPQSSLMPPTSQYAANASQSRIAAITAALGDSDGSEEEDELAKLRAQIRKVYCPYKVSHHLIA